MKNKDLIIKTAIISFGLSGRVFHAPFIHCHKGFTLSKVVERNHQNSKTIYPYVEVVKEYQDVIKDPNIDLIAVCTPNIFHYQMAKEALLAGKHIIVEKPFTTTIAEANELIEIAEKAKLKIFVYHNRRWDGDFLVIEKLLHDKTLGNINYFESHFDRYIPEITSTKTWKNTNLPASGVLYDLGSHLIHQTLTLFGFPKSVGAIIKTKRNASNVPDYFELTLKYSSLTAVLKSDMLVADHELRFVVKGDKGKYTQFGIDPQENILNNGIMPQGENWCPADRDNYGNFQQLGSNKLERLQTRPGNYMHFYNNVYEVLREQKAINIEPTEGRDVLKVCEMALESHKQKKIISI